MWQFNIVTKEKVENKVRIVVHFEQGQEKLDREYWFERIDNIESLKDKIRIELDILAKRDQFFNAVPTGAIDLTKPQPPSPTPKQIKEAEYNKKFEELEQAKHSLDLGLIIQVEYDILVNELKLLKANL